MRKSNSSHNRAANDELEISIAIYYAKLETDEKLTLYSYNSIVTICLLDR